MHVDLARPATPPASYYRRQYNAYVIVLLHIHIRGGICIRSCSDVVGSTYACFRAE
jgi:hypothetical protein